MLLNQVCLGCRASREQGSSSRAERSSIDLAAGLARSPQKARQDSEDSCEFDSGLFPSFKTGESFAAQMHCSAITGWDALKNASMQCTSRMHTD